MQHSRSPEIFSALAVIVGVLVAYLVNSIT